MKVQYKSGGDTRDGNRMMLKNQAVEFKHHAQELSNAVKKAKHVDAWVVAKAERATTDLSDITHYLDGQSEKYAKGGLMPGGYVLSQLSDTEAIDLANATLKDEVGYAEDMMFNSGYAARRFLREYHSGKAEVDEDSVVDRFSQTDDLSDEARIIVEKYRDINHDEDSISEMRDELMAVGYVFDYDDDMIPYSLRRIGEEDDDDGMFADGGKTKDSYADSLSLQNILNVGDILTNAVGKRLKVYAITPSEYVLLPFGGFPSPWRKDRIHELVKTGEWVLDKFKEKGGEIEDEGESMKEDFLEDVKELHGEIKSITLKDGSKISHKELMEAHKMASGGMMAKGGKIEVGDILILPKNMNITELGIKDKITNNQKILTSKWVVKEIYTDNLGDDRIVINNSKEERTTYLDKVEKYNNYFKYGVQFNDGGMMAKGGQIDADEVEKAAKYYADNPNWTVEKLKKEVSEHEDLLENWEAGNIKPSKIIGGGYKSSSVARKLADNWIRRQLAIFRRALELKQQAAQKTITQTEENNPQIGDDVRGFNHKYGTTVKDVDTEGRRFKIKQSDYWDSGDIWVSFDDVTQDTDDRRTWRREVMPTIDTKRKPGEIMIGNQIVKLKFIKRCCPSIKSDGSVGNYEYSFVDEQGEPYTGYGNTKEEALKSIEDYLNKAPEVNVSDNKNTIQPEEASIGDSALVVSENKLGTISNIDFGMYYLKFVDGRTMWYNASDLRFFKDEDDYPDEETSVEPEKNPVPDYTQEKIREAIDALEILAEMGDEQAQEAIDALKLLLTDADEDVIIAYTDDRDTPIRTFKSREEAKKFAKANKWKYDEITFEDKKGDTIRVSKDDKFKDVDWLFSSLFAKGGMMKKGGITGGYEDLTDMYMSQKIEMLLSKIRPYENYYIDQVSNKLYIYFTTEITTDESQYVMDLLTSSPEFFKADTAAIDYDSERDRAVVSVELNRKVEYGKGGTTFQDKVNAISRRLDGTEVPRRLRSEYGRRYNKEEAKKAAQRIAGAMRKKGY